MLCEWIDDNAERSLGNRAFFLWDGTDFYYINDLDGISRPSIDAAGQKICEVIPEKDRHMIVLKELRLPGKDHISK